MMLKKLATFIYFETQITLRQPFTWITPLLFFVIVVCFFPLALGADKTLLHHVAPAIIWIAALLAILISINNLFCHDLQEGYLDLILLSSHPVMLLVLAKMLSHWLTHALPLICVSPLLGLLLDLSYQEQLACIITLLLGTPVLTFLGGIAAALVVSIRNTSLLLPILVMPLYVPVLIFGTGALIAANQHQPLNAYYAIMGAFLLLTAAFSPFFSAMALRIGVNQ